MYVRRNIHARSHNLCCNAKTISISYSVCVFVSLVMRHEKRMRRIILSSVRYFSILSHKRHNFQENVIEHKMCIFIFSTTFVWNFSHSKKNWARNDKNINWASRKVGVILPDFNETWIFSTDFRKILQNQIFCKSVWWQPSCSMRTDWRTDGHDETNSQFSEFCERAWRQRQKENDMKWNFKSNL